MDADADGAVLSERSPKLAVIAVVAGLGGLAATPAHTEGQTAVPLPGPRTEAEIGAERLIETLSARLLTSHSATAVLEAWCAERGLSTDPRLAAVRVPGPDKPLTPLQRERLRVGPHEPIRYRRVRLTCGGHVLSEADNWYVPGRLTPEMNAVLETTQTPFGRVVHPLKPSRRNLAMQVLWKPGEEAAPGPDRRLFFVEAVLSTGDGVPFCEVAETYTGAVLLRGER